MSTSPVNIYLGNRIEVKVCEKTVIEIVDGDVSDKIEFYVDRGGGVNLKRALHRRLVFEEIN